MGKRKSSARSSRKKADRSDPCAIAERRQQVAQLHARGKPLPVIAHMLDVSLSTVRRDLAELENQWLEAAREDVGAVKAREVALLERARQEALDAYYAAANRHGETKQVGYLAAYVRLSERIHTLLGLEDPMVIGNSEEDVVEILEIEVETREDLQKFQRLKVEQLQELVKT